MPVHVHTLRAGFAAALGLIVLGALFDWAYAPPPPEIPLVTVTGRATCGGRPLGDVTVVLEEEAQRGFIALGKTRPDGSFRMEPWGNLGRDGVAPGTYRVYVIARDELATASGLPARYRAPATSDLVVHVARSDWNGLALSLPDDRTGPTLAQHR